MLKHLCPCCGRHCYLDEPKCERGKQYLETGVIPPRSHKHHGGEGKKPSEKRMQYAALEREGKLVWNIREMGKMISSLEDVDGGEVFTCLRDDDRAALLMLLEKVRHDLQHRQAKSES